MGILSAHKLMCVPVRAGERALERAGERALERAGWLLLEPQAVSQHVAIP